MYADYNELTTRQDGLGKTRVSSTYTAATSVEVRNTYLLNTNRSELASNRGQIRLVTETAAIRNASDLTSKSVSVCG